jgi:atypical dual specificity phosphatase
MSVENFSWVIPNKIAGSAVPDFASWRDDAVWLASEGVRVLVSLVMPYGSVEEECKAAGIDWIYYPITDFHVPEDDESFSELIDTIVDRMKRDRGVCVHCHAGIGRTGLVLACAVGRYLGLPSEQAIAAVRNVRMSIETIVQEEFIRRFLDEQQNRT